MVGLGSGSIKQVVTLWFVGTRLLFLLVLMTME